MYTRSDYLSDLRAWLTGALESYERDTEEWLENAERHFWGFSPPGHPVSVAQVEAFLWKEDADDTLASRAAERLASFGQFRDRFPLDRLGTRAEYPCRDRCRSRARPRSSGSAARLAEPAA